MKRLAVTSIALPFACAVAAGFFTYFPITDSDIFWHLASGREIIAHGHLLFSDPFSYTLVNPKWVDLHWLFQLLTYGIYCIGQLTGLLVFKAILIALTAIGVTAALPKPVYRITSAIAMTILLYYARYLICIRPVLLTMFFMATYVLLFERIKAGAPKRWLWLCVPVQIVWTNSQGLYPIGLFIIGSYWFENAVAYYLRKPATEARGEKRPDHFYTLIFTISGAACFVNPYGISGILLPLTLLGRISPDANNIYSMNISENLPLLAVSGFEAVYRIVVFTCAIASALLCIVNYKRLRIAHVFLIAGFGYLAFNAVRNVPLFIVVIVPVFSYYASATADTAERIFPKLYPKILAGITAAGLCCMAFLGTQQYAIIKTYPYKSQLSPFRFPDNICNYLTQHPIRGELYNDLRYGGYFIWKFYPPKKVFADTRLIIRTPQFFAEYLAIGNNPDLFFAVAEKFHITHAAMPSAIFNEQRQLIKALYRSTQWHLEFCDGTSFLFVKNDVAQRKGINLSDTNDVNRIEKSIEKEWEKSEYIRNEALGHFNEMLAYLRSPS